MYPQSSPRSEPNEKKDHLRHELTPIPTPTQLAFAANQRPTARQASTISIALALLLWGCAQSLCQNQNDLAVAQSWTFSTVAEWNYPGRRLGACTVWTGQELIVWGGWDEELNRKVDTGVRYHPATGRVTPMSLANAPRARWHASAVWTGHELIVWGGEDTDDDALRDGHRYDPQTDRWRPISQDDAPVERFLHTAVWTGREMIVWGGGVTFDDNDFDGRRHDEWSDGGRYDPVTDRWQALNLDNAPAPRRAHTAVWTGRSMIVCGGHRLFRTGDGVEVGLRFYDRYFLPKEMGEYDPMSDTWRRTEPDAAFVARTGHTAVWTGQEMIVWGGFDVDGYDSNFQPRRHALNTGARYLPELDRWRLATEVNAPSGRFGHVAAWNGREMLIIGGEDEREGGGHYDPAADRWRRIPIVGAPAVATSGAWTGSEWLLHGDRLSRYRLLGPYQEDGIPDEWQLHHFGENQAAGLAQADPDGDRQTNATEFRFGTDPNRSASKVQVQLSPPAAAATEWQLRFSPVLPDWRYEVYGQTSVEGAPQATPILRVSDQGDQRTWVLPRDLRQRQGYFQIRAVAP